MRACFDMGLAFKEDELYSLVGMSKPEEGDTTVSLAQIAKLQQQSQSQFGQPGGFGAQEPSPKVQAQAELDRQLREVGEKVAA